MNAKNPTAQDDIAALEATRLVAPDSVRLVAPVLGMSIFTAEPLSSAAAGLLDIYERFLEMVGPSALRFYATETMRSHKAVAKTTLGMLPLWLKAGAPEREYISIELKDGSQHQDAPSIKFQVHGIEPKNKMFNKGRANVLSISLAPSAADSDLARFKDLFVHACSVLPVQSGLAGYALECSRYDAEASETHAWGAGMRLRGVDICRIPVDCQAVGIDGMKGVNWLTAVGGPLSNALGGIDSIKRGMSSEVRFVDTPNAIVIQAGDAPTSGDANRPDTLGAYRAVFAKLRQPIEHAGRRSMSFNLASDYVEKTERWYSRLSDD